VVTRDELARLLGEALTNRLEDARFWTGHPVAGVRVRLLAEQVAEDISKEVGCDE